MGKHYSTIEPRGDEEHAPPKEGLMIRAKTYINGCANKIEEFRGPDQKSYPHRAQKRIHMTSNCTIRGGGKRKFTTPRGKPTTLLQRV